MPDILFNFQSGVLSADPGSGGTVLNSGNFANLPAIVAPNTLRLALDPEGLAGTPEIVVVTAHTAFATTVTVTRGQETAYGAGAARAHAIDTIWRHTLTRATLVELMVQAGVVQATVRSTPDPGFVFIDGSTIVNGQVIYPAAWAAIPATWKSAPDIVLPDWRGCTLFMDDAGALFALGATAGSNTHAITQAELPAVPLSIDPPSTNVSINPPATAVTGSTGAGTPHAHSDVEPGNVGLVAGGPNPVIADSIVSSTGNESVHTHPAGTLSVDIAPFNVAVDIAPFPSPNLGSGTAMDLRPKHGVVNFQLKVH